MSLTTPTTVLHRPSFGGASPDVRRLPTALSPGQNRRASVSLTMKTPGAPGVIVAFVEIPALDDIDADRLEVTWRDPLDGQSRCAVLPPAGRPSIVTH